MPISIYPEDAGATDNDVGTMASCSQPETSDAQLRADENRRSERSKTQPINVVQPRTLAWAADLPGDIQPQQLLRSFARIANLIASRWDEPRALYVYFGELLIDRRKGRRGFPPEVRSELLALRAYYSHLDLQRCITGHSLENERGVRHPRKSPRGRSSSGR